MELLYCAKQFILRYSPWVSLGVSFVNNEFEQLTRNGKPNTSRAAADRNQDMFLGSSTENNYRNIFIGEL